MGILHLFRFRMDLLRKRRRMISCVGGMDVVGGAAFVGVPSVRDCDVRGWLGGGCVGESFVVSTLGSCGSVAGEGCATLGSV